MRPLAAILVCVAFIGVTALFTRDRVGGVEETARVTRASAQAVTIEIVPTVPLEPDPFALRGTNEEAGPALTVYINGTRLLEIRKPFAAGEVVRVDSVPGLIEGTNELYVEASPSLAVSSGVSGLRVRILKGYETAREMAIWSDFFEKLSGTLSFDFHEAHSGKSHVAH